MTKRSKYRSRNAKSLAIRRFALGFFFALSFVSFGFFEPWNWKNDPKDQWGKEVITNFDELNDALKRKGADVEAFLDAMPWTNTYYPKWKGGFATRYNGMSERQLGRYALTYPLYSNSQLVRMSEVELEELSAAEKLDIINGRTTDRMKDDYDRALRSGYDTSRLPYYRYTRFIRDDVEEDVKNPTDGANAYTGWCEPLALASIHHKEPDFTRYRMTLEGEEILLPLKSSDMKAFLMMAYDQKMDSLSDSDQDYKMVDRKCYDPSHENYKPENCKYINAGTFHVVLLNQIGINKKGFVADFDGGRAVWNHAVEGYRILESYWYTDRDGNYLHSSKAHPASTKEKVFKTKIFYVKNSLGVHKYAMGSKNVANEYYYSKTMSYRVEMDDSGKIYGGTWLESTADPMDFFWYYPKIEKFEADYQFLNDI